MIKDCKNCRYSIIELNNTGARQACEHKVLGQQCSLWKKKRGRFYNLKWENCYFKQLDNICVVLYGNEEIRGRLINWQSNSISLELLNNGPVKYVFYQTIKYIIKE